MYPPHRKLHYCDECNIQYMNVRNLVVHQLFYCQNVKLPKYPCKKCGCKFNVLDDLDFHLENVPDCVSRKIHARASSGYKRRHSSNEGNSSRKRSKSVDWSSSVRRCSPIETSSSFERASIIQTTNQVKQSIVRPSFGQEFLPSYSGSLSVASRQTASETLVTSKVQQASTNPTVITKSTSSNPKSVIQRRNISTASTQKCNAELTVDRIVEHFTSDKQTISSPSVLSNENVINSSSEKSFNPCSSTQLAGASSSKSFAGPSNQNARLEQKPDALNSRAVTQSLSKPKSCSVLLCFFDAPTSSLFLDTCTMYALSPENVENQELPSVLSPQAISEREMSLRNASSTETATEGGIAAETDEENDVIIKKEDVAGEEINEGEISEREMHSRNSSSTETASGGGVAETDGENHVTVKGMGTTHEETNVEKISENEDKYSPHSSSTKTATEGCTAAETDKESDVIIKKVDVAGKEINVVHEEINVGEISEREMHSRNASSTETASGGGVAETDGENHLTVTGMGAAHEKINVEKISETGDDSADSAENDVTIKRIDVTGEEINVVHEEINVGEISEREVHSRNSSMTKTASEGGVAETASECGVAETASEGRVAETASEGRVAETASEGRVAETDEENHVTVKGMGVAHAEINVEKISERGDEDSPHSSSTETAMQRSTAVETEEESDETIKRIDITGEEINVVHEEINVGKILEREMHSRNSSSTETASEGGVTETYGENHVTLKGMGAAHEETNVERISEREDECSPHSSSTEMATGDSIDAETEENDVTMKKTM